MGFLLCNCTISHEIDDGYGWIGKKHGMGWDGTCAIKILLGYY